MGFDVKPEGVQAGADQPIQIRPRQPPAVGLQQYPGVPGALLDPLGDLSVIIGATGDVAAGEGHDVARRAEPLRAEDDLVRVENAGTARARFAVEYAGAAPSTQDRAVVHGSALAWLPDGDVSLVGAGHVGDFVRGVPGTAVALGKFPGVAFAATVVTAGLIDGEVVLRAG